MRLTISTGGEGGRLAPGLEATVLIVDEDPEALDYYASVLWRNGYLVQTCGSYEESMRLLQPGLYSLVVVGQGTWRFEGRAVLEHSKKIDWNRPVLVLARCLDMNCYIEAIQMGAEDYFAGALPASEIVQAVSRYVHPVNPKGSVTPGSA